MSMFNCIVHYCPRFPTDTSTSETMGCLSISANSCLAVHSLGTPNLCLAFLNTSDSSSVCTTSASCAGPCDDDDAPVCAGPCDDIKSPRECYVYLLLRWCQMCRSLRYSRTNCAPGGGCCVVATSGL